MTHGLTEEEVIALVEENAKLKRRLEAVKRVSVFGARMDVHPTRMGGSAEVLEEAMWWQSWLMNFDESWRSRLKSALEDEDPDPSRF